MDFSRLLASTVSAGGDPIQCASPQEAYQVFMESWLYEDFKDFTAMYCIGHQKWEPLTSHYLSACFESQLGYDFKTYFLSLSGFLRRRIPIPGLPFSFPSPCAEHKTDQFTLYTLGPASVIQWGQFFLNSRREVTSTGPIESVQVVLLRKEEF